MKSEQWKWVNIAKGIGIILVLLGHFNIPDTLRAEIYTFHIPLFFFLSGVVFNGHKPINRFLGDEAKRMIVPYYCWAFFYFVLFKLLVQTVRGQSVNIGKDVYTYLTMGRKDTIWFLSALLCVQVMAYIFLRLVKNNKALLMFFALLLFSICYLFFYKRGIHNFWINADAAMMALPFFALSLLQNRYRSKITAWRLGILAFVYYAFLSKYRFGIFELSSYRCAGGYVSQQLWKSIFDVAVGL